jgi:hypothetical protein
MACTKVQEADTCTFFAHDFSHLFPHGEMQGTIARNPFLPDQPRPGGSLDWGNHLLLACIYA